MSGIYSDIAQRCGGNIYIGVVGPVRTGKSTFIKKFMESLVLPNISDENTKQRALDEMPQSAQGKTVMTTEPKFVPDEPVRISFDNNVSMNVKMVDCVGYIVPDVMGLVEEGAPRMVHTPWSDLPMPFEEAAELGTRKVIKEHSTIGMVVTTDGSITDIARESYVDAERRVIGEVKAQKLPFVIILNSAHPDSPETIALAQELESTYLAPVALVNCLELDADDIRAILSLTLSEFPIKEIRVEMPSWTRALDSEHAIRRSIREYISAKSKSARKINDLSDMFADADKCEYVKSMSISEISLGVGEAHVCVTLDDGLYYKTVSEMTGLDISSEEEMIRTLATLAQTKKKYDRIAEALEAAETRGYGIVMPEVSDLKLEEPEIVKQPGGYGVKLRASAPSIHMIKAGIETEISPVVGTEQQSEDLVKYLLAEFEENPSKIWESNMFGRTLYELVNDGLHSKLENMPDDARDKLSETLGRIINEGSGGLICIIL
ncbi:MAG: stage IV sporulation protein A [Ruminococcaceae bacterium]|nr:stage IV sporulation protein A [Oscillospiraceae bacterium]